jgi:hypothetical protein
MNDGDRLQSADGSKCGADNHQFEFLDTFSFNEVDECRKCGRRKYRNTQTGDIWYSDRKFEGQNRLPISAYSRRSYRKLRIAWSVVWGIAAVLLFAWGLRSYRHEEFFSLWGHWIGLYHGSIMIDFARPNGRGTGWIAVGQGFNFPHWFPIAVFSTLAIVPWLQSLRWRFSLRALLIATTLVAVGLGLIVWLR